MQDYVFLKVNTTRCFLCPDLVAGHSSASPLPFSEVRPPSFPIHLVSSSVLRQREGRTMSGKHMEAEDRLSPG